MDVVLHTAVDYTEVAIIDFLFFWDSRIQGQFWLGFGRFVAFLNPGSWTTRKGMDSLPQLALQ